MPLCVITTEGLNYNFPQPTCFASPPGSAYCQLQQELAYLKPTTSFSKSQQGVIKASVEFTQLAQRPFPKDSLETYCIFSPLILTFDFKVDRSDLGNFSVETNQRPLDKKGTYSILWKARAHGGDTICWREVGVFKEVCSMKSNIWARCSKWALKGECYLLKGGKRLKPNKDG